MCEHENCVVIHHPSRKERRTMGWWWQKTMSKNKDGDIRATWHKQEEVTDRMNEEQRKMKRWIAVKNSIKHYPWIGAMVINYVPKKNIDWSNGG